MPVVELRTDDRERPRSSASCRCSGTVVVSTVAVFAFGFDTNTVVDAAEQILDMDQTLQ